MSAKDFYLTSILFLILIVLHITNCQIGGSERLKDLEDVFNTVVEDKE